jgi:TonB family protein
MGDKSALRIRVTEPDGKCTESRFHAESVLIGSGPDAGARISDDTVSSLHLMLKCDRRGGVTAIDLGSEHGTRRGAQVLEMPLDLSPGDILQIGASRIQVFFGESAVDPIRSPQPVVLPAWKLAGRNLPMLQNGSPFDQASPEREDKVLQVAMFWGDALAAVQHFQPRSQITIGHGARSHFPVFSDGIGRRRVLAEVRGSKLLVHSPTPSSVAVRREDEASDEPLVFENSNRGEQSEIELGLRDQVQVDLENLTFLFRFVPPPPLVAATPGSGEERQSRFFTIAAGCMMVGMALIGLLLMTSSGKNRWLEDNYAAPASYARLLIKPERKQINRLKNLAGRPEGEKAAEEEGKFGRQDAKKEEASPSLPGSPIVDSRKPEEDRKKVMRAGLLGAIGNASDFASNVFGPGGLGTGLNNALGGLKPGAGPGDARGAGGLGSRGSGPGGGGTALGLGGLGTKGDGDGAGGYGSIDLSGRGKESTRIIPGKTIVVGGLSKEVIAKIIRDHQSEIKYCYEVELQRHPSLYGKVAVLFTIDGSGTVSQASVAESSLGNPSAEQCMLARIRRWKFPEPQGGGLVSVNFPWVFKPAGSEGS